MASLTYKLEKLAARALAGKKPTVKVGGVPTYYFAGALFGGTSPTLWLKPIAGGESQAKSCAEWRRLGVEI